MEGEEHGVAADSPDSEVINLTPDNQVVGKVDEVIRHPKISSKAFPCMGVVTDLHLTRLAGEDGKTDVKLLQADNFNSGERLPSPEIINNVILLEKQHQKGENGEVSLLNDANKGCYKELLFLSSFFGSSVSGEAKNCQGGSETDIYGSHDMGFESTDSNVPKELLVYVKGHKNSKSSKSRIVGENLLEVTNSMDKQKRKALRSKGNNGKLVKAKIKEEGGQSRDVCKTENDQETEMGIQRRLIANQT